jgi:type III restriction enzyme
VDAFVKNQGLNFAIPYLHNGQAHDYVPDFIVRLKTSPVVHLILETKGYEPLEDVKRAAADRWVAAVNADGTFGKWSYVVVKKMTDVPKVIGEVAG